MTDSALGGVYTILLTPFTDSGELDLRGLALQVERQRRAGVDGLLVGGTYGEFPVMSCDEREAVLEAVVDAAEGLPVLACAAHSDERDVLRLARHAVRAGAAAVMIMPPYVSEVRFDDVAEFFARVHHETGADLVVYNTPGSGTSLAPHDLLRLAEIRGVVGVKQGVTSIGWLDETQVLLGDRFRIMCASDLVFPAGLALGMHGCTSTNASLLPDLFVAMWRAAREDRWSDMLRLHRAWAPLRTLLRRFGQPQTTKAALDLRGLPGGPVRPPLRPLNAAQRAEVARVLDALERVPVEA